MPIWGNIIPSPERLRLGETTRIPLKNNFIGIYHLVAIDRYPRQRGFDYEWYYLILCKVERIKKNNNLFEKIKKILLRKGEK